MCDCHPVHVLLLITVFSVAITVLLISNMVVLLWQWSTHAPLYLLCYVQQTNQSVKISYHEYANNERFPLSRHHTMRRESRSC